MAKAVSLNSVYEDMRVDPTRVAWIVYQCTNQDSSANKKPHSILFILIACLYFQQGSAISFNFQ